MSRYTLSVMPTGGYHIVLDRGKATKAKALKGVVFSDECEIKGGTFERGFFYGGTFEGGWFYGGFFEGGVFKGGTFKGGTFKSGTFTKGAFIGGYYEEGYLRFLIQGSSHFVNIPDGKSIQIGCLKHSPEQWLENYVDIGFIEGFSDERIEEYKLYIDLAIKIIEKNAEITKAN